MPPNCGMVQLDIGHWPLATVARSVNFWRSPTELDLACHGASLKRATASSCCAALCLYHLFMNYIYLHKYLHLYTVKIMTMYHIYKTDRMTRLWGLHLNYRHHFPEKRKLQIIIQFFVFVEKLKYF